MTMRRFLVAPALAGVLLVTMSCTNPFQTTSTATDTATVAPEVKTAVEEFVAKLNDHNASAAADYMSDDQNFQWVEDGRVLYETKTAAVTGLQNFFLGFGASRFEAYDLKIAMLDDDAAVATFKYTQTIAASGQASLKVEGAMTLALTERDGSWKILAGHKSAGGFPRQ